MSSTRSPRSGPTSGKELALEVQQIVGLDPELSIVILGRDGSLKVADPAAAFLEKADFAGGDIAERLFPMGRNVPVVLDPDRSFGEPTVSGGVRTDVLAELVDAGEEPEQLAEIYSLPVGESRRAAGYERRRNELSAARSDSMACRTGFHCVEGKRPTTSGVPDSRRWGRSSRAVVPAATAPGHRRTRQPGGGCPTLRP
jgi:uncharacterized protein (DUF433 family)